jgi:hypothetical protein
VTTYRLMDGASGRPGVGSSGTQPPSAATSYSGDYLAGLVFNVSQGGLWFEGYWWWVPATGGQTGAQEFALWQVVSGGGGGSGTLVPGSVVTSGTLTAGVWNFVALATPLLLSANIPYVAATGFVCTTGFPLTQNQFGASDPYASGITNGPLVAYPSGSTLTGVAQMPFSVGASDPTVGMPNENDQDDNLWIDVQVTDIAPSGATYRAWPNMPGVWPEVVTSSDTTGYTLGLAFSLTELCLLSKIWHYSPPGVGIAALPTRCLIWDVASQAAVASTDNTSPSWLDPDGSPATAGDGWVYCDYASSNVILNNSQNYKVSTYHAPGSTWFGATPGVYGTGDLQAAGFTQGPINVPGNAAAPSPGQQSWNAASFGYPATSTDPEADWIDVEVIPLGLSVLQAATASGFSNEATFGNPVTEGSYLLIASSAYAFGSTPPDNTDSPTLGGTPPAGAAQLQYIQSPTAGGDTVAEALWLLPVTAAIAGATAIECPWSGEDGYAGVVAIETSGWAAAPAVDQSSTGQGASDTVTSGDTGATLQQPELIFGMSIGFAQVQAFPSGYVNYNGQGSGADQYFVAGWTAALTSGGTYAYGGTAESSANWAAGIVTLAVQAGSSGAATLAGAGTLATAAGQGAGASPQGAGTVATAAADRAGAALAGAGTLTTPDSALQGVASLTGAGSVGTAATLEAGAALTGNGSVAAPAGQDTDGALAGSGQLAAPDSILEPGASLTGAGSLADTTEQGVGGPLTGSGTLGQPAAAGQAGSTLTGSATLAAPASAQAAAATLTGVGTLTGLPAGQGGADLTGAGQVGAPGSAQDAPASLAGSATLATASAEAAGTALAGAGNMTAPPAVQEAGGTLTGQGTLTGSGSQPSGASAAFDGAGTLTAGLAEQAPAALTGAGTLTAPVAPPGAAGLQGAGALTAPSAGLPALSLAGAGTLAQAATQSAAAVLAGAGQLAGTPAGQGQTGTSGLLMAGFP